VGIGEGDRGDPLSRVTRWVDPAARCGHSRAWLLPRSHRGAPQARTGAPSAGRSWRRTRITTREMITASSAITAATRKAAGWWRWPQPPPPPLCAVAGGHRLVEHGAGDATRCPRRTARGGRAAGAEQMRQLGAGCARGDGHQDGQSERAADLLAGVEQCGGQSGLVPAYAGDGGQRQRHEGRAHAHGDEQRRSRPSACSGCRSYRRTPITGRCCCQQAAEVPARRR
jgi:hypothetical protein